MRQLRALPLIALGFCALPMVSRADGLSYVQAGTGTPTVVFEAGAGEQLDTWKKVLPDVSKLTRTFAYTRRGYGGMPALNHRDGASIVEELRALLRDQHIEPPYILVGHSIGGLYMQLFAKTFPQEVAGLVLVDTTCADQFERMKTERPGKYRLAKTMMSINATTVGAEMRGIEETRTEWHAAGPLPAVPVILLSAMRDTAINGAEFTQFIQGLHRELAASWSGAELRMVDSDHFVQKHRPEDVVRAVRDVLERAKAR